MHYMRLLRADGDGAAPVEPGTPIAFTAVTPGKKRDGVDTAELPWTVDRFRSNPIVTWVHDFVGNRLPIGRAEVEVMPGDAGESIRAEVLFDSADPFAAEIERKYRDGYLHAVSVSWDDVDDDGIPVRVSGNKPVAHELLELASVPVPGDPSALAERQVTALRSLRDDLDAILTDEHPATDPEADADPDPDTDPGDASPSDEDSWRACAAAMVDVFDRGSDDSDEKRRRAYNALLPTYRRLAKEPPEWVGGDELRALDDDNWRALFLADEIEVAGLRAGAELSARNIQDLSSAVADIQAGVDRIESLLERVASKDQPSEGGDRADGEASTVLDALSGWLDTRLEGEEADDDPAS